MTQKEMIDKLFGRPSAKGAKGGRTRVPTLPRQSVEHDSVDKMRFNIYRDDSPRFREIAVERRPRITPDVKDPDPIDFTTASPEEIKAWQADAKAARAARENAPEYENWEYLGRDAFYGYHHSSEPQVVDPDKLDPAVAHHAKIMSKIFAQPEFAQTRNITRNEPIPSAGAAIAVSSKLAELLQDQAIEQARQSEDFEEARQQAEGAMQQLDDLRQEAAELHDQGQPVPGELVAQIKQAVIDKRQAQGQAADIALNTPIPFDKAAHDAIVEAARAGLEAAESMSTVPSFAQGFGEGEPRYESPEQALSIAELWANNPTLKAVSELYGRLDRDMRFNRAKRVVGGADEIVDLKFGDDIRRVLPSELASLADPDFEDDFYARYLGAEIRVFDTVGDENAGKGPICLVCDESYSMVNERNIWAKALAMVLLNICRREKRDFAYSGFSSGNQVVTYLFKAKEPLVAQQVVDMASHFFGGGTTPVIGLAEADNVMSQAEFRKADVVMVSDGEAAFGPEDKRLRDRMQAKGVRFHAIGIGGPFRYLHDMTDDVVDVHDFDLTDPSEATAHLATHIS